MNIFLYKRVCFRLIQLASTATGMQSIPLALPDSAFRTQQSTDFRNTQQQRNAEILPAPREPISNGPATGSAQRVEKDRSGLNQSGQTQPYNEIFNIPPVKFVAKRSSKHVIYAVEILVFAIVGWGWLALREFMGAPPVMDISIFVCLLISAAVNLGMALIYYTTDQFKPAAQGFFSHMLSIWALYAYSLTESTTGGWNPLCCDGQSSYSVTKTYAAAYFGGLPFHQTAGAFTLGFISVFLILAAGQVRVCLEDPRVWLLRKVTTSLVCLISLHLGIFALQSGACDGGNLGRAVIVVSILAWILMADIIPVILSLVFPLTDDVKKLIQMISELALTLTLMAVSVVLSSMLGGRPSSVLMFIFGVAALWQIGSIVVQSVTIRVLNQQQPQTEDYSPSAPPEHSIRMNLGLRGQYTRPVMLFPDTREMKLHETRRREKAW